MHFWVSERVPNAHGSFGGSTELVQVASFRRSFEYEIDPDRVVTGDTSVELRAAIEQSIKARLTVEYDSARQEWVPIVKLELIKSIAPPNDQNVLFGGGISINVVWADSYDPDGLAYLKGNWDNWWLWERIQKNAQRVEVPGSQQSPPVVIDYPSSYQIRLSAENAWSNQLPGELEKSHYQASNSGKSPARVIVKMKTQQGSGLKHFGGLWGETVYEGELVFEIDRWTPIELKRYIVNGIVPDHAMP